MRALDDVAVLVLVRVAVQRRAQATGRDRVLDEREAAAGLGAPDHEAHAERGEVDGARRRRGRRGVAPGLRRSAGAVSREFIGRLHFVEHNVARKRSALPWRAVNIIEQRCPRKPDGHTRSGAARSPSWRRGSASRRPPSSCTAPLGPPGRRSARSHSAPASSARRVYRHFPRGRRPVRRLLGALRSAAHPYPAPDAWPAIARPGRAHPRGARRAVRATTERVEPMLANVTRDAQLLPELARRDGGRRRLLRCGRGDPRWPAGPATPRVGGRRLAVAMDFATWQTLSRRAAGRRARPR